MSENYSKTKHSSDSCVNGDNKRLKIEESDNLSINSSYSQNLDQLRSWYSSTTKPEDIDVSGIRLIDKPFKLICFDNFIKNEDFLDVIKKEIKQLDLNVKNNDLYRLRQSVDLNNIKSGPIDRLCHLFRQKIKPFVQRLTDISLNDNIALTVSRYEQNDYLLCHDDIEDEGRRIAFILYLVPDWDRSDGGLLDLFDTNDNGEPSDVVESLIPKWNSFAFFEVNPVTWHQVSEVLSDSKIRLSVNGWFHGSPRVRPTRNVEPQYSTESATDVPLDIVKSWINPLYLNDSTQIEIQTRFGELSEIVLQDFFVSEKYQELERALTASEAIDWQWCGPPNMRRHESAKPTSCPAIVLEAFDLLKSEAMFLILSNMTGLKLHELAIDLNSDEEEDSNDTSEGNPRCRGEIRRWSHSCYTMVHDNSHETNEGEALDVVIHFNCQKEYDYRENGGFISYIAKGEDEELLTVDPNNNCLNIVFRDNKTTRFVKYINSKCVDSFHDFSFVYYQ